jgi:hypothetical protein
MEDGRWKMEDGRWKMEDGRWWMVDVFEASGPDAFAGFWKHQKTRDQSTLR